MRKTEIWLHRTQLIFLRRSNKPLSAARLYQEIAIARADGSYPKLMNKLSKIKLLIIDDFCIPPMSDPQRLDLLEVLEDRQSISSTIIATQVPIENWIE